MAAFFLNNRSEARCVVVSKHKDCVYVGGENEFGYLKPDASGMLRYHCVSEKLGKVYRSLGNVFDIYEVDGALYYRCDNYILIANNGNYRLIRAPHKIFSSVMSDMVLYVATDCGLYSLMGNKLVPAQGTEVLMGKRINAMFKYGKGIVITTANDGLFYYNGSEVMDFHTAADGLFLNAGICCASINNGLLAVGTIHNGLVLVDLKTGSTSVYNEINGLQSNTVLSVGFDDMGNVWAGLDYGIDYINLNAPFSYLYKSPYSYGMGKASYLRMDFFIWLRIEDCSVPITLSSSIMVMLTSVSWMFLREWHGIFIATAMRCFACTIRAYSLLWVHRSRR